MVRLAIAATALVSVVTWSACALATGTDRPPSHEVRRVEDVAYYAGKDAHATKHRLDLYLPQGAEQFPVLFFVHGGAWCSGDKQRFRQLGAAFARRGIGVVATNYRLTPEVTHPGHIEDVARAFAWTHEHIADCGGDPATIFVCGHSAGGHLVALLALDERHLKAHELNRASIAGVIPISGVFNLNHGIGPIRRSVLGTDPDTHRDASPITYAKKLAAEVEPLPEANGEKNNQAMLQGELPPFFIIFAERDPKRLRDDAAELKEALEKAGQKPEYLLVRRRTHGSIIARVGTPLDRTTHEIMRFIRKHSPEATE